MNKTLMEKVMERKALYNRVDCSAYQNPQSEEGIGQKFDGEKQKWHALPLVLLEPLADLMEAGARKYEKFNCLEDFANPDERFWNANMRHAEQCQLDPLAIDEETGCYHEACRAFSSLMRLYHCKKQQVSK